MSLELCLRHRIRLKNISSALSRILSAAVILLDCALHSCNFLQVEPMSKPDPFAVCKNLGSGTHLLDPDHEAKQATDVAWLSRYGKHAGIRDAQTAALKQLT